MQSIRLSQRTSLYRNEIDICSPELANIISYPDFSVGEYSSRLNEISSFGITHFLPTGRTRIGKITIAGKGCVSIVLKVKAKNKICALKIRRTDANRHTMKREAYLHEIANSAGVGPVLFRSSKNLITMEFIDGLSIVDWINKQDVGADEARNVAISVLEQCYRLDTAQIDHGQLSCLNHHIIVSKSNNTANVIDYESSSTQRKPSNVNAAAQSLFVSGLISSRINQLVKLFHREKIIQLLKIYKWNPTRTNFDNIVGMFC
jgi:putative serine/threonine protein kinase